jgi:outer membrane protein assembly factor BamE (lipoprotein component of BamABCDE complex)
MSPQKWIPALAAALLLASCSATQARISANEDLFENYTLEEQAMIKSNRIDRGFDSTQVYLAFGHADQTSMEGEQEIWHYYRSHNRKVREEKTAGEYREELSAYGHAVEQGKQGLQEPATYRVITLYRTRVQRLVRFEAGRVVGWDEPDDMWVDDWHQ